MATKLKDMVEGEPDALAASVAASAQQIWQAGLGAFARARKEGGNLFEMLVREGAELHKLTPQAGPAQAGGMAGRLGRLTENVGRQASGSWDRIERIFEDRVAAALRSLGVPTREEVEALRREVEALKAALAQAAPGAAAARPARAASKAAPAKPAAKRAARSAAGRHA